MANLYWASAVNGGGTGAMDAYDPTDMDGSATALAVGDACVVIDEGEGTFAVYEAKSTASMSESFPDIIIPDTNPSNWWWDCVKITFDYEQACNAALAYANIPGSF